MSAGQDRNGRVRRGAVPVGFEFEVFWDDLAHAWQALANRGKSDSMCGYGSTPTSALIAAEIEILKAAKR